MANGWSCSRKPSPRLSGWPSSGNPSGSRGNLALTEMEAAAKALGLKLLSLEVRSLDDFEGAFARAKKDGAQALITTTGALINTQQRQVLDFAAKNRLPAMYPDSEFVEAGGLMSYAPRHIRTYGGAPLTLSTRS